MQDRKTIWPIIAVAGPDYVKGWRLCGWLDVGHKPGYDIRWCVYPDWRIFFAPLAIWLMRKLHY